MKINIAQLAIIFATLCLLISTSQADEPLTGHLKKGWQVAAARDGAWIMGSKKPFPQAHYGIHELIFATSAGEITANGTLDLVSNQPDETIFKLKFNPMSIDKFKPNHQPDLEYRARLSGNIAFNNNQNACLIAGKIIHDSPTTAHLLLDKKKSTCLIEIQYEIDSVCDGLVLTAAEEIPLTVTQLTIYDKKTF